MKQVQEEHLCRDIHKIARALEKIAKALPSAEQEAHDINVGNMDAISRQQAIDVLHGYFDGMLETDTVCPADIYGLFECMPSAQPERTCVNCGRTANNGGWYADGRTRCPIEEHYALPKDGFCHLWEKRNVTDDDYPERMEE